MIVAIVVICRHHGDDHYHFLRIDQSVFELAHKNPPLNWVLCGMDQYNYHQDQQMHALTHVLKDANR